MSVFLCRVCGGALNVSANMTGCICGFCGSRQSLPRLNISEKAAVLERADNYRKVQDFDRAASLYEQALAFDIEDADIYFMLTLCRYGVIYENNVPVMTRLVKQTVTSDGNYKSAVFYGDDFQKSVFRYQANQLSEYQQRLLSACDTENCDIFLCLNRRSGECYSSAQKIKRQLSTEGYSVSLGEQIDALQREKAVTSPFITAALHSAEIMLLMALSPDDLREVQVKSEWSEYISQANGRNLVLLHNGLSAEKVPSELSFAPKIDISAIGWEQDLLRGVGKIIRRDSGNKILITEAADNSAILKRAEIHLQNGNFDEVLSLCDRLLQSGSANAEAEAHFTRALAANKCRTAEELCRLSRDIFDIEDFRQAYIQSEGEFKDKLATYRLTSLCYLRDNSKSYDELSALANKLGELGYADERKICTDKLEEIKAGEAERNYLAAMDIFKNSTDVQVLNSAADFLKTISDYKDSALLSEKCRKKAEGIQLGAHTAAMEKSRSDTNKILAAVAIGFGIFALFIIGTFLLTEQTASSIVTPAEEKYNRGISLLESGRYGEAEEIFTELYGYSDAETQLNEARYQQAAEHFGAERYKQAMEGFEALSGYKDSTDRFNEAKYFHGVKLKTQKNYKEAAQIFKELDGYRDSAEQQKSSQYLYAQSLADNDEFKDAANEFQKLGGYGDAKAKESEMWYKLAQQYRDKGSYASAINYFKMAGDYGDAAARLNETVRGYAESLAAEGLYENAVNIISYTDNAEAMKKLRYDIAAIALKNGDYGFALQQFELLGEYGDSSDKMLQIRYEMAKALRGEQKYSEAAEIFSELGDYLDSREQTAQIKNILSFEKGSIIELGSYPQTENGSNLPIQWIALECDGESVLLISRYVIDSRPMDGASWETSGLRYWLNSDFISTAFTESEKNRLTETEIKTKTNGYGETATTDKVFLLSCDEVNKYFPEFREAIGENTEYSSQVRIDRLYELLGENEDNIHYAASKTANWWLRTSGGHDRFHYVNSASGGCKNDWVNDEYYGVRPAIWLSIGG